MPKPDVKPTAAAVGQLRSWLATHGVPAATANEIVKTAKTMHAIGTELATWLHDRPKAKS
jgi:hypothetical protein